MDNMGKLLVTLFAFLPACARLADASRTGQSGRCSCSQDKFVAAVSPGHAHL